MWVDTLCISQYDSLTKSREIGLMGAIYANAIVTIVAADGDDTNYGLRGFKGLSDQRDHTLKEPGCSRSTIFRNIGSCSTIRWYDGSVDEDCTDDDFDFHAIGDRIHTISITK
ncbi:HET-domain-containing protein [Venturia nashicola]|uniref:HET-domain-containing protein n=1 Tax=Venturia nashicola TaxID=86259 RepID=A0A4Z1P8H8_9PEZI|nr:HET-domain-containing protein [Venturia nashicola]